ncbi:MAG: MotA/TolQ/ExbB proton channel family protein [Gammaproteobacteria bacterium]|nr:MotA/TolQ/ExbB proton channel family protein [Gammaproteobacteria bacterium]
MSVLKRHRSAVLTALILGCSWGLASLPAAAQDTGAAPAASAPTAATSIAAPTSAAAPAEAAPPVAMPATHNEAVKNPYGFGALWDNGDFLARGIIIVLLIMSMGSWYVTFTKLFEQARLLRQARMAKKQFWDASSVQEGIDRLKPGSPFRYIAESGTDASRQHESQMLEKIDLHTWVMQSIQRASENIQTSLQSGLAFLATVGSTAVFVGLLGTVWGIYHALIAIGISGQASIDKVAGPVGEALIMTAIGLGVAVPAVLCYNWLVRRNKMAIEQVRSFAADLYAVLMAQTPPSTAAR